MGRPFNFAAGPSMLPESVLKSVSDAVIDYEGHGYSILEMMHRKPPFEAILLELKSRVKSLLAVPDDFEILFCPGGGKTQFAMVPLNLVTQGCRGGYVVTGTWSRWAGNNRELPANVIHVPRDVEYVYFCDNETVDGTEFKGLPAVDDNDALFVSDMSSNFMSRPVDWTRYAAVWAGVQKNFGTAGLACVIVRRDQLRRNRAADARLERLRQEQQPAEHAARASVLHRHADGPLGRRAGRRRRDGPSREGALGPSLRHHRQHGRLLREPHRARSRMNVVFTLADETLLPVFVKEAEAQGLTNLAGHRSVGGLRASLYNVMPMEGVERLTAFMRDFAGRHVERH